MMSLIQEMIYSCNFLIICVFAFARAWRRKFSQQRSRRKRLRRYRTIVTFERDGALSHKRSPSSTAQPSLRETRVRAERRRTKKERSRRSGEGKWSEGNENGEHGERRPVVVRHRAIGGGATAHLPAGRGLSQCPPGWKSVRRFSCPS